MAPIKPHWQQPSHPDTQEVIVNETDFMTKSISRVTLPPFGLFAKMSFPPCSTIPKATYASVQMGEDRHFLFNSDLVYINHSCEPNLIFDTGNMNIMAGPNGLKVGDELTFFYPSTEWEMAQPFDCLCGTPSCRKVIDGAKNMGSEQLKGYWLSGHIHELLQKQANSNCEPLYEDSPDFTAQALKNALDLAEKTAEAARQALQNYTGKFHVDNDSVVFNEAEVGCGISGNGLERRGVTSREMSGEMGGDTSIQV